MTTSTTAPAARSRLRHQSWPGPRDVQREGDWPMQMTGLATAPSNIGGQSFLRQVWPWARSKHQDHHRQEAGRLSLARAEREK
jgi:hypothetical protein